MYAFDALLYTTQLDYVHLKKEQNVNRFPRMSHRSNKASP